MSHDSPVTRPGALDSRLRLAIANRLLLQLRYGGSTRVVEPHDYGRHKGTVRLLVYQRSRTGSAPDDDVRGWRMFDVPKIDACSVLSEPFEGSRDAEQQHHQWDELFARVR